jgi:alcohol dehydrogenase (cytochrome c)
VTTRSGREIAASANKDGLLSVVDRRHAKDGLMPLAYQVPTTTRENIDTPLSRDKKTRFCPGYLGGSEWNGAAFSPPLNTIYVGAADWCSTVQLVPATAPVPAKGAGWFGAATQSMDPPANAKGWLTAFDADNGAVLWKLETGQTMGGGIVSYLAGGKQRIGVAAGMKSPIWPGGSSASQIVVYGVP